VELNNYFGEDYNLLDPSAKNEIAEVFLESSGEEKEWRYEEPLKAVFIHKTKHEMFLVLDCRKVELDHIKSLCEEWENKVLNFVNFGKEYRQSINYLKYNISLLILCIDIEGYKDDEFRFETEKSTRICRKIFLLCNKDGHILKDDEVMLPFYFEPLQEVNDTKTQQLESELSELLPDDERILSICKKKKALSPDDIDIMSRWLIKDDNN